MAPRRRALFLLFLLAPALASAQSESGLYEEEIPVVGLSIQRRSATSGQGKAPVKKKASQHAPDNKSNPTPDPDAAEDHQWVADANPEAAKPKVRRVLFDIGGGDEPIRDLKEPPFVKDYELPYDWDSRVLLRADGVALRMKLRERLGFQEFTLIGRLRFNIITRTGLQRVQDDMYDWVNLTAPPDRRGFLVGFQARKSDRWGFSADYDKLTMNPVEGPLSDQVTSLGAGYSPLGHNKGKRWNYQVNGSVHYQDLSHTVGGLHKSEAGVGFAIGPVYRYGLDWVPIPGFSERTRKKHKIKLDHFRLHAAYSDSTLHPATLALGTDLVLYASRYLRLSAGADQIYVPSKGDWRFNNKIKLAVIIHFLAVKY